MKKNSCLINEYPLIEDDFFADRDQPTIEENYFFERYYKKTNEDIQDLLKNGFPLFFLMEIDESNPKVFAYYFVCLINFIMEHSRDEEYGFDAIEAYIYSATVLEKRLESCRQYDFCIGCIALYVEWAIENYKHLDVSEDIYGNIERKWQNLQNRLLKRHQL